MAFKFRWVCELMRDLENNRFKKAAAESRSINPDAQVVVAWFNRHHTQIPRYGDAAIAFLSCMFPERRPDRVYNLQRKRLASIFGRSLGLGTSRMKELNGWQEKNGADFALCVEAIMAQAEFDEPPSGYEVTLEELNEALDELAARSNFSSLVIRSKEKPREAHMILNSLLQRLQSWEAIWLVRMLLKSFAPVIIPEHLAMSHFHFLLRDLLNLQNSFDAVVKILSGARVRQIPPRPSRDCEAALKLGIVDELVPEVGVMIKRPAYDKARSIKHCCDMASGRTMSLERKYDGEYCQVHIDMSNPKDCMRIFSKSGKDSTTDRVRLHGAIKECLSLSTPQCAIKKQCVLEGELLVWNTRKRALEPFHKIRKHVQRAGRFLGNLADSPPSLDEHLMIMFYDILLFDDKICLRETHTKRRRRLEALVKPVPGNAGIGTREKINFASRRAPEQLRCAFANAITQRWEGFVLKGCDEAHMPMHGAGRCIKLKKDYIAGMGDTADLVIVGGRRDPRTEQELQLGRLLWTEFYLACLENKDEVGRFGEKPVLRVLDVLSQHSIPKDDIIFLNERGQFSQVPFASSGEELEVRFDRGFLQRPAELFKQPFVVEVCGAGFAKRENITYFSLRFPRVVKVHLDRPVSETVSLSELQVLAKNSLETPVDAASQEDRKWIEDLEKADPKKGRYIIDNSQSTTPGQSLGSPTTASSSTTPNTRSKLRSPVLIRADTAELSPCERAQRELEQSTRASTTPSTTTHSSREETRSPLKRKLPFTDMTPAPNSPSKRGKFVQTAQTAHRQAREQVVECADHRETVSSPCEGVINRIQRPAAKGLRTTPPWCKWPAQFDSSPTSHLDNPRRPELQSPARSNGPQLNIAGNANRPAPNSGQPLSEITNSSQELARMPLHSGVNNPSTPANERGSPVLGRATALRKRLEQVAVSTRRPRRRHHHFTVATALLPPPPPTSSPLNVEAEKYCNAAPTSSAATVMVIPGPSANIADKITAPVLPPVIGMGGTTVSEDHAASDSNWTQQAVPSKRLAARGRTPRRTTSPMMSLTYPILLSKSLCDISAQPELSSLLGQTPASFTYSMSYFMSSLASLSLCTPGTRTENQDPNTIQNQTPHPSHVHLIALVDTTRPSAVVADIHDVMSALRTQLPSLSRSTPNSSQTTTVQGQIIFLDWTALYALHDLHHLRRTFGGCLVWDSGFGYQSQQEHHQGPVVLPATDGFETDVQSKTRGKRRSIRAVWDWAEVFAPPATADVSTS